MFPLNIKNVKDALVQVESESVQRLLSVNPYQLQPYINLNLPENEIDYISDLKLTVLGLFVNSGNQWRHSDFRFQLIWWER